MASADVVLTARVMQVPKKAGAADVARFMRYVQYRDIHPDSKEARDVDDLIGYVHHRDPTSPRGRMFDAEGPAGEDERRVMVDLVSRSNAELLTRENPSRTSLRAAYRLIISPEEARGLDLKRLTRAMMARLQADAGGKLPPWIAGEHRNTLHPHVHIVLAARRETQPGEFRTLVITRERLAAMKDALHAEMELQRGAHVNMRGSALRAGEAETMSRLHTKRSPLQPLAPISTRYNAGVVEMLGWTGNQSRRSQRFRPGFEVAAIAGRLSRHHLREAERLARQRRFHGDEDDLDRRGWRRRR
jgi:hypothetical protein